MRGSRRMCRMNTIIRRRRSGEPRSIGSPEQHRKTRQARSEEIGQDYVELIDELIRSNGEARVIDIARAFGVTHVTVNRTVARLQKQGLVTARRYRSIFLTEAGQKLAARMRRRHRVVFEFLMALGVDEAIAVIDAEGIEHHVSDQTVKAFERFSAKKRSVR